LLSVGRTYTLIGRDGLQYESPRKGKLGGHRGTGVYGRLDCPVALSLIARGRNRADLRVFFADEETAIAAGFRPCGACMREEYRRWKAGT
jgi:metal binding Ada-like protein